MADLTHKQERDNTLYNLPPQDTLGVLTSTREVLQRSRQVWLDHEQLERFCTHLLQIEDTNSTEEASTQDTCWNNQYHFFDGTEQTINWLLVLDTLNFCFWGEKNQTRWSIEYHGETLNGYWAEAAALKRAVEEDGLPLWDASYLQQITKETMQHIFRGTGAIPLLEQRVQNAQEVGHVLLNRYDGQFSRALAQANFDAVQIALLLANNFPSFQDMAFYQTHKIALLKRAQIYVADLASAFAGSTWGNISNLAQLTIFADYKLPQVLRHFSILHYTDDLAERIDNQILIEAGSEEEIEIRACSIWACELLCQKLNAHGKQITATEIDHYLWHLGQKSDDMKPYHRTRTIYY